MTISRSLFLQCHQQTNYTPTTLSSANHRVYVCFFPLFFHFRVLALMTSSFLWTRGSRAKLKCLHQVCWLALHLCIDPSWRIDCSRAASLLLHCCFTAALPDGKHRRNAKDRKQEDEEENLEWLAVSNPTFPPCSSLFAFSTVAFPQRMFALRASVSLLIWPRLNPIIGCVLAFSRSVWCGRMCGRPKQC